jgi:dipeptide/tripeptide permease
MIKYIRAFTQFLLLNFRLVPRLGHQTFPPPPSLTTVQQTLLFDAILSELLHFLTMLATFVIGCNHRVVSEENFGKNMDRKSCSLICSGHYQYFYCLIMCLKLQKGERNTLVVICLVLLLFVLFYVLFVCKGLLPPGDNPIAVNKYILSYILYDLRRHP